MSRKALQETLQYILDEIKQNSTVYRELVSDKIAHEIVVSSSDIEQEILREIASSNNITIGEIPSNIVSTIKTEVPKMCSTLYDSFSPSEFNLSRQVYEFKEIVGTKHNFTAVIALSEKAGKTASVFRKIKEIKQKCQKPLLDALNTQIGLLSVKDETTLKTISSSKFLDIGHSERSAVSRQRKLKVEQALYNFSSRPSPQAAAFLSQISKELSLSIDKDPGLPQTKLTVSFESSTLNQLKGATTEKQFASITGSLTKDLKVVLERLGGEYWVEQEGSSSQYDLIEAEILNPLSLVAGKKVKNTIKYRKTNIRRNKVNKSDKRPKVTKARQPIDRKADIKLPDSRENISSFPLELLVILNKRLPATVMKNMEYPALENRTGRFANSVKAVDVITTTKGFPSIGYTYQMDPYQIFEPGGPMGSTERDPKRLIDRSIREIASEYAMMRFYTRRV